MGAQSGGQWVGLGGGGGWGRMSVGGGEGASRVGGLFIICRSFMLLTFNAPEALLFQKG